MPKFRKRSYTPPPLFVLECISGVTRKFQRGPHQNGGGGQFKYHKELNCVSKMPATSWISFLQILLHRYVRCISRKFIKVFQNLLFYFSWPLNSCKKKLTNGRKKTIPLSRWPKKWRSKYFTSLN